jgi:hypothetical protein
MMLVESSEFTNQPTPPPTAKPNKKLARGRFDSFDSLASEDPRPLPPTSEIGSEGSGTENREKANYE